MHTYSPLILGEPNNFSRADAPRSAPLPPAPPPEPREMAEPRALDAMAQLPALVEAAVRADRESGGEEGEGEGE